MVIHPFSFSQLPILWLNCHPLAPTPTIPCLFLVSLLYWRPRWLCLYTVDWVSIHIWFFPTMDPSSCPFPFSQPQPIRFAMWRTSPSTLVFIFRSPLVVPVLSLPSRSIFAPEADQKSVNHLSLFPRPQHGLVAWSFCAAVPLAFVLCISPPAFLCPLLCVKVESAVSYCYRFEAGTSTRCSISLLLSSPYLFFSVALVACSAVSIASIAVVPWFMLVPTPSDRVPPPGLLMVARKQ